MAGIIVQPYQPVSMLAVDSASIEELANNLTWGT